MLSANIVGQGMLGAESATTRERDEMDRTRGVCIYEVDPERIVRRAFCAGTDEAGANKLGRSVLHLVPLQVRTSLQERLQEIFATGRVSSMQYRLRRPDREDRVLEARISPAGSGRALPESVHVAIIDVTELVAENERSCRRNAERETQPETYLRVAREGSVPDARHGADEHLRETDRHLETAQAVARVGSWDWDLETNRVIWTPELYRIFGVDPGGLRPSMAAVMPLVHPDDAERFRQQIALWQGGIEGGRLDFRIRRPDGNERFVSSRAKAERDGAGCLTRVIGTIQDVTEWVHRQLALEKALREADMFRRVVDLSSQAIGTADLEARVLYQNPALLRLLGNPSLEAAQEHTYEHFYQGEDLEYLRSEVIPTVLAEGHWTGELDVQPLGGNPPVPTIQSIYLVRDDVGQPIAFSNVITNISDQKRTEQALRASEAKYRGLFENALFGIAIADVQTGEILDCNPALCRMVARSRDEIVGQHQRILHPLSALECGVSRSFELHRSGCHDRVSDEQLITAAGEIRHVEIKANFIDWGGRRAIQGVFHDITDRKRAEVALLEEKERAQVTLHSIGDAVIATDEYGRIGFLNPVAEELTGWRSGEARGRDLDEVFRTQDEAGGEPLENPVVRCLHDGRIFKRSSPTVLIGRDGRQHDIDESAAPIRRPDGTVLGVVLVFHDVSETRRLTREMAYEAAHDALTGLLNRRELEDRLGKALESARDRGARHALCYMDLDRFKIVNDTAGHAAGDELLKQIKGMLEGVFRDRDTFARLGGDEFGLLLDNCPIDRAVSIANSILDIFRAYRFVWAGRSYPIGASIGVTTIGSESESVAQLLSQADVACYTAKELGRNRVHVYRAQDGAPIERHSEILQAAGLRDAMELNRFRLSCQRILPLKDDEPGDLCYELLLRLDDGDGNLILPEVFIPAAERFGLMGELDRWVIRTAFRSYASVFDRQPARIFLNLSKSSLGDSRLLDYVRDQLGTFGIPCGCVCFEIAEAAAAQDLTHASQVFAGLRALGCQIALDDVGSGLFSLRYLKELPVDYLKVDGSFVESIADDLEGRAVVAAVNRLAHRLGIRMIAVRASSDRVIDELRKLNVDFAQGYAVGRPLPLSERQPGR